MKIACIGWGSLVWNPGQLAYRGSWNNDGPLLPIEFCRQSDDGRLTLVIVEGKPVVRTLWTLMSSSSVEEARNNLAEREGIKGKKARDAKIHFWQADINTNEQMPAFDYRAEIARWAKQHDLSAVVWTALSSRYKKDDDRVFKKEDDRAPSEDEAVDYLRTRPHEVRRIAEEYIRRTPRQIDTDFRRRFEREFGWTPIE